MKAVLVTGSARTNSHTRALVDKVESELNARNIETVIWDLAEKPLPPFEVPFHRDQSLVVNENAKQFLEDLNSADMVVFGTSLYHGSYSGIIKNAIDYLLKDQLFEKPVGLVCNGGGNTKNSQALGHLVTIVQTIYGVPMQTQIGTSGNDFTETDSGFELNNQGIIERCERLADELVRFTTALKR